MSGIPSDGDERPRLDAAALPDELQRLWDTMLRLDPEWDMFDWLTERANEELKIIDANLGREKMRLEQRIARLEALANRIGRDIELNEGGTKQCNLFDAFGPAHRADAEEQEEGDSWEPHPATAHLQYLPDDIGDDPLLAVCAQAILLHFEMKEEHGELPETLEGLGLALVPRGIDTDELVEALEWLLRQGSIIEIDENVFTLG
ncbi:MAG: hypothetical protein VYA86_03140 [Candidatus Thermoplasmatota archaeon]|nr:hypothetical protein [Candidatus Thermoplasmatota archaeon]